MNERSQLTNDEREMMILLVKFALVSLPMLDGLCSRFYVINQDSKEFFEKIKQIGIKLETLYQEQEPCK